MNHVIKPNTTTPSSEALSQSADRGDHFMKRQLLSATLLLLFAGLMASACSQRGSGKGRGGNAAPARLTDGVEAFDVDGIRVIVKHQDGARLTSVSVYFDGGAPYWLSGKVGAEQLALSTATQSGPVGTTRAQYAADLDRFGASVGGSSGNDYARVGMSALTDAMETPWRLFTGAIVSPALAESEIELHRSRQLNGVETRLDSPDSAVVEVAQQLAFRGHPYAQHADGEIDTVPGLTREDLVESLDRLRVRERMVVVFVGGVEAEDARQMVHDAFGSLPSNPTWATDLVQTTQRSDLTFETSALEVDERADLPTNYIIGYFDAPEHTSPDYAATMLATKLLRERLFEEVRTLRNLTYAVASGMGTRRDNVGYLYVTATDPETTLGVMYDTIDALIEEPPAASMVRDLALVDLTDYFMDLETAGAQASLLAEWELLGGGWEHADSVNDQLRSVTPEDISDALQRYVRNIQFGVVGDPTEIPEELFLSR